MTAEPIFPAWFRRLPIYTTMQRDARLADETQRSALAAERDHIRAAETRDAPKRHRAVDAARSAADVAKLKYDDALALSRRAEADAMAPAQTAHHRIAIIERELTRLAHPAISTALASLLDRFELTRQRSTDTTATLIKLEQIADARRKLEGLTITAGLDATAVVAAIMAALEPQPAAHGVES